MGVVSLKDLYSDFESDGENVLLLSEDRLFGEVSLKELVEFYVEHDGPYRKVPRRMKN